MKRKVRIVKAPTLCQLFSKLRRQPGERFRVVLTNDTTDPSSGKRLDEVVQVELDRIEAPTENRPTFLLRGRGYRPGTASAIRCHTSLIFSTCRSCLVNGIPESPFLVELV